MGKSLLIVEDDVEIVRLLRYRFEKEGFAVSSATDGRIALAEMRRKRPDLVILDVMLPGVDGLEICRQIRRHERYRAIPVIILSGKGEEADRVVGLELGADDYVTKPFGTRELIARVRALLRRQDSGSRPTILRGGELVIDASAHAVTAAGRRIELSAQEFRLLYHLASHPGMVFSREQLLDRVWGHDRVVMPRTIDVHVRRIREKIESDPENPKFIQTVHGVGYRLANQDQS